MLMLVAAMVMPSVAWAQTMYTVFDTKTGTLTFKYDDSKPESTETQKVYDVLPTFSYKIQPGWKVEYGSSIKTVVFDASFADARPTNCHMWFHLCGELTNIVGIENLNTSEVHDMGYMFTYCEKLTSLDLSNFNTAKVTTMEYMLYDCSSLQSLDLSNFNTAKVEAMSYMFGECTKLTTIYVSDGFTTSSVNGSADMFYNCKSLVGTTAYSSGMIRVEGANYRTGYFTYGIKTADDLKAFAQCVNGTYTVGDGETATAYPAVSAGLLKDITLTDADSFEPITSSYTGTFDGRGHSIGGLNFTSTNNCLFANNSSGTIKNLGVVNATMAEGSNGCICQTNSGTIASCFLMGTAEGTTSPSGTICQTNNGTITNCCYLADRETDAIEGATAMTAAQFRSGAVAWLLNGSSADVKWGQLLGTEDYPVGDGAKVYQCTPCTGVYSNDENKVTAEHTWPAEYENGLKICSVCGDKLYQPATQNASGEYEIGNAGQLCWFAGLVNGTLTDGTSQNKTAKGVLTGNIDLTSISNWTPIGNASNKFGGTFDGKGFKVLNMSIKQQGYYTGLFGYASGATMQNICIDGNITLTTTTYTEGYGSIAGRIDNSTISNCHSSVNFTINTKMDASKECIGHIGGIVGKMDESKSTESYVSGCSYSGTMNLGNNNVKVAAGIVGFATYSDVPITNCSFTGTIDSKYEGALYMGGIFGYTRTSGNVKVTNCLQAGTLNKPGNSSLTGVLIGQINGGYGKDAITNNYYTSSTFNVIGSTSGTPTTTPATLCSTTQLNSGEVTYLLNGASTYGGWGQQLGEDKYPVPGSPYKIITTSKKSENDTYWATFSDLTSDVTLSVPSTRTLKVYNTTVSGGKLTLTERDDNQVAMSEGVLLKTDGEYVNVKANETDGLSRVDYAYNNLVATPSTAQTITADDNYTLYRLTYNSFESKDKLGFYLSLVKDENGKVVEASVGKQLKAIPGKAYLNVLSSEALNIRGFAFPEDGETTGIECITVTNESLHRNGNAEGIFDLQGRKVNKPAKGVYIKNNRLFLN